MVKVLLQIAIFHSKCESFPPRMFSRIQYCNIYYYNTIQYSLRKYWYNAVHCNILWYIAMYCNAFCINDVIIQSLYHKSDWTSSNLGYRITHFVFLRFRYMVTQGIYSFLYVCICICMYVCMYICNEAICVTDS